MQPFNSNHNERPIALTASYSDYAASHNTTVVKGAADLTTCWDTENVSASAGFNISYFGSVIILSQHAICQSHPKEQFFPTPCISLESTQ